MFELTLQADPVGRPARRAGLSAAGGHDAAGAAGAEPVAVPGSSRSASSSWCRPTSGWACSSGRCTRFCCGTCGRNSSASARRRSCTTACSNWAGRARCCSRRWPGPVSATIEVAFESGAQQLPEVPLRVPAGRTVRPAASCTPALEQLCAGGGQAAAAAGRCLRGRDLCRCGSPRRGGRVAARRLRHARLPDAAACCRGSGVARRGRAVVHESDPPTHRQRSEQRADLAAAAARVLPRARLSRSRNAARGGRGHSRAAHRADALGKRRSFCRRRPSCT